jgi:hypothetical protein
MEGTKHEQLVKALAVCVDQLNVENRTETDGVIKQSAKMICKHCTLIL